MPREIEVAGAYGTARMPGLVEEGGLVLEGEPDPNRAPATIHGEVRDGARRAMVGAVVRIVGTDLRATTDNDGRYVLRDVPPGLQFVVVDHTSLVELGVRAGEGQVLLDDGSRREVSFSAPSVSEIITTLCDGRDIPRHRATIRVILTDSATQRPLSGVRLRVASKDGRGFETVDETDAGGAAVFCGVPADLPLVVTESGRGVLAELTLRRGQVVGRSIRVRTQAAPFN
jgi:hypothetical protein